jgi:hypothetical protein
MLIVALAEANKDVNPISPWVINGALIFLSASLAFFTTVFFNSRKEAREREKRLVALESQLALVNAAVVPISTAFQAILIKELTHFHTPEMDALLVKIGPPNVLTEDERDRLAVMLIERTEDLGSEISSSERDAAHILPAVMKRAQAEQDTLQLASRLKLKLLTIAEVIAIPHPQIREDELHK